MLDRMVNMIIRQEYINKISSFIGKPFIKILVGVRRSGKSTIMLMLMNELKTRKVDEHCIVYAKFDSLEFEGWDAKELLAFLKAKLVNGEKTYLFLDEIQEIAGWERAINELFDSAQYRYNVDIFLTGSNSRMLSSEISTYLTGRYVRFDVYPLSFAEYIEFSRPLSDARKAFFDYAQMGGFPALHANNMDQTSAYTAVFDIYNTTIFTDIVKRSNIRNVEQLERIVKFVFENVGNTFSAKSISDYLKSQNRKIDIETVYNYLSKLEDAYILYRCSRFDLHGKEVLKTQEKFYLADPALKYALMGYNESGISVTLENLVYLELKRRGYEVYVGKYKDIEIDFVAERRGEMIYVQVAKEISRLQTERREYENLLRIKDNYPKYVLTLSELSGGNYKGIKSAHIADWLLSEF